MKLFPDEVISAADWSLTPGFLSSAAADAALADLTAQTPWTQDRLRLGGRDIVAPRRISWHGDQNCVYRYSGTIHDPEPWFRALADLRDRVMTETGQQFNCALLNLYRDGTDSMGWHSDNERELGERPVVASLSLGAERRFRFRAKRDPSKTATLVLPHGSMLLMGPACQINWQHSLPKMVGIRHPRLNVTFRLIDAR
jgi:alkylated DNA repair dioxygenase AlkB